MCHSGYANPVKQPCMCSVLCVIKTEKAVRQSEPFYQSRRQAVIVRTPHKNVETSDVIV